jgi:hypothetical protein
VRHRPGGERQTEETLSVLLSFDVKCLPDKVMLGYISYPVRDCVSRTHYFVTGAKFMVMLQQYE